MESNYDENLMENMFLQILRKDYFELFLKSISEGCVISVPRAGSLPSYLLTLEDFLGHILIPSDELPESHFRTLNGNEAKICNQVVIVEHDVGHHTSTHILFEETFYTEDFLKYKVLCLEQPLEQGTDGVHIDSSVMPLNTLRDCMDFLWMESGNREIIENIDRAIQNFMSHNTLGNETASLQSIKDNIGLLYTKCVQVALRDQKFKEKTLTNKFVLNNLKTAVETYMHHAVYSKVMNDVMVCTSFEDAQLNKIIRNLSDMQIRDLDIKAELHDCIPCAKTELSHIGGYSTVLGKISCLKKMLTAITKHPVYGNIVAADDLLPVMIFLIIKTSLPNWHAQLKYLKLFRFSVSSSFQNDEGSFLITTLEAALQHIQSGILMGCASPEGQGDMGTTQCLSLKEHNQSTRTISNFFQQISCGNLESVIDILKESKKLVINYGELNLCHPLCDCQKCMALISKNQCEITPTVKSCDDRGVSALHIAAMYDRPMVVDYLLVHGADPNVTDCNGLTPIHYTAMRGHQNALLLLAHSGADINVTDNSFNTPLHLCSNNGHKGCVKALIYFSEHVGIKLNVDTCNVNGDTPLHHAARWGYLGIVKNLILSHANPALQNKRKLTPMDMAHNAKILAILNTEQQEPKHFVRLKSKSVSFDFTDDDAKSLGSVSKTELYGCRPTSTKLAKKLDNLLRAIACGDINLACFYLSIDPTVLTTPSPSQDEVSDRVGKSVSCHPLCDCPTCVTIAVSDARTPEECPLDVNTCNSEGLTPLHVAATHGQLNLARVLLHNGAMLDVRTRHKLLTPLMIATQNQRVHLTKLLLLMGANVDLQDSRGNTALHYACHSTNTRLVELLVKFEARSDIKNHNNVSCLRVAEEKMSLTIIKVLKGKQALDLNHF